MHGHVKTRLPQRRSLQCAHQPRSLPDLLLCVCRPGMYIYLCMPAASQLQWHPISLAGSPSADSLAVLVSNSGALLQLVNK